MDPIAAVIFIVILIASVIIHELSHGYAALYLGDPTAKFEGRLTLNPSAHVDVIGSILVPSILFLSQAPFLFGWAKPVPYNPHNFSNQRWGEAFVAFAGSGANLLVALFFGLLIRFSLELGLNFTAFLQISALIVVVNIGLALFNMMPLPPLDGSKVLASVLPYRLWLPYTAFIQRMERFGPLLFIGILLLAVYVLSGPLNFINQKIFTLITGLPFY